MTTPSPRLPHAMSGRDIILGAGWGLAAAACHSLVPIAVRLLASHIPPVELVFFRNVIGLVIIVSVVSWRGFGFVRTHNIGKHVQRNLLNFAGMWLWFGALAFLPLSKAVALHFTLPLMLVPLAIIFLHERPGPVRIVCTVIGFAGVLVILRPGAVPIGWASLAVLSSALCYAGVGAYTRVLGRTDAAATTSFYYHSMLSVMALAPALFVWVTPAIADIPALLLLGVAGTAAPYCLVRGMIHAEATIVEPLEYLRLPFTAALAWIIFAETTDGWIWLGAAIIAASTWYMAHHEHKAAT